MSHCSHLQFDHIMNENLKAAAEQDDIDLLYRQIQADPYALERIDARPFIHTPLHVAVAAGKIRFAIEIMRLKPSFAWKLNERGESPMHLALQNPDPIVSRLVDINKDVIRVKGKNGLTPLHLATGDGRVELLAEFLFACPESIEDVTVQNETALHIAVKEGQFEALRVLVCWLMKNYKKGSSNVVNLRSVLEKQDADGNTVLHILVARNDTNLEMVELLKQGMINLNAKNSDQLTALDIVERESQNRNDANIVKIKNMLLGAKALRGDLVPFIPTLAETLVTKEKLTFAFYAKTFVQRFEGVSNETRNILLIVATLVLTTTSQAAMSPPGGVFQAEADQQKPAGMTVMNKDTFRVFKFVNILSFALSSIVIVILLPHARGLRALAMAPFIYFLFCFFFSMSVIEHPLSNQNSRLSVSFYITLATVMAVWFLKIMCSSPQRRRDQA